MEKRTYLILRLTEPAAAASLLTRRLVRMMALGALY